MTIKDDSIEQKILQAAREIFIRRGYEAATMQEIAEEAGTSRTSLHYYYRTKKKLFEAIFDDILRLNLPLLIGTLIARRPFKQKIKQFVSLYMEALSKNPYMPSFICGEMQHQPNMLIQKIRSLQLDTEQLFRIMNYQLKQEGLGHIPAEHLIISIVSMCVFPSVVKPLIQELLDKKNKNASRQFMEERSNAIIELISNALDNEKKHVINPSGKHHL